MLPGVLEKGVNRNLVVCAPTSSGKTRVADIVMLRRLVQQNRPGLLVLPYRTLCEQKARLWLDSPVSGNSNPNPYTMTAPHRTVTRLCSGCVVLALLATRNAHRNAECHLIDRMALPPT